MAKRRIIRNRTIGDFQAAPEPAEGADPDNRPEVEFIGGPIGKLAHIATLQTQTIGGVSVPKFIRITVEMPDIPSPLNEYGVRTKLSELGFSLAFDERCKVVEFLNALVGKTVIMGFEDASENPK